MKKGEIAASPPIDKIVKKLYVKDKFKKLVAKRLKFKLKSNFKKELKKTLLLNDKNLKKLEKIIHPEVRKAMQSFVKKNTAATKILIPNLDNDIKNAYYQIEEIIKKESPSSIIGSSLGGFYGTYFAEKFNLLCVNINPAIPPIDMSEYLGENINYSTGDKFIINQEQLDWLEYMNKEIKHLKKHKNFMTLIQSGDEVLDYKLAVTFFCGSQIEVIFGGNHSFENFESYIPKIQSFLNMH